MSNPMVIAQETTDRAPDALRDTSALTDLLPVMQRLDVLLEHAMAVADVVYRPEAATDPYRGLYIDPSDVEHALFQAPGHPIFAWGRDVVRGLPSDHMPAGSRWRQLQQTFGLTAFDLDVIAIALAPEFDVRYEQLYAYLHNDVTRKRPSLDLALNLLSTDADAKLRQRARFTPQAPLLRHGLLHLHAAPHKERASALTLTLKLDEQVTGFLLGITGLDAELATYCDLSISTAQFEDACLPLEVIQGLRACAHQAEKTHQPLQLYFEGSPGLGQRTAAEALAAHLNRPLLVVDLAQIHQTASDSLRLLKRAGCTARLQRAVVLLEGWEIVTTTDKPLPETAVTATLPLEQSIFILTGEQPWHRHTGPWKDIITIPFARPDFALRRKHWQAQLSTAHGALEAHDLEALADRFRLTPDQIRQAVVQSRKHAHWRAATQVAKTAKRNGKAESVLSAPPQPTRDDLFAAARAQSGQDLAAMARKIEPRQQWDQLILPANPLRQLKDICNQARHRPIVYEDWGFGNRLSSGKGLTVLFTGPPGTGKTMAAEVIASDLELDLYMIDLSQVVSKYIGETEKNLNRIFTAAEQANAILLFDEADAIFGKRSEVKDAHDRYANLEVAYLLQKMEAFEGISILTSNLRQNLDDAFTRRIGFIVEFPFPEEDTRLQIWQGIWPTETPLADDVDLPLLARQFKLAGGSIRNIALAAAFLAAEEAQSVQRHHLLQATRREFQKMGRLIDEHAFVAAASDAESPDNTDA